MFALLMSLPVFAQRRDSVFTRNLLKVNLTAFAVKTLSLQYERIVASRFSLAFGYKRIEKDHLPLQEEFSAYLDNDESARQMKNLRVGGQAFTPELRFYLSRKGAPKGFYAAPYVRYANFDLELPYEFDFNSTVETVNMSGELRTFGGGLMFGGQFRIFRFLYADIWLAGGHYGFAKGQMSGSRALSEEQQKALSSSFGRLKVPFKDSSTYSVSSTGAVLDLDSPWAGLRSGINLAVRF